jgi:hypothetical protein
VKKIKAAPAANIPFLKVSHDGVLSWKKTLVWRAFLTDAASRQISAIANVTLSCIKRHDCSFSLSLENKKKQFGVNAVH